MTIDRIIPSIGEQVMLPLIGAFVVSIMGNNEDWRHKYAGIMAFA